MVGQRLGVEYRLSTSVSAISLDSSGKKATGVILSSGETLSADIVISNADLVYTYNNLLPQTRYSRSLARRPASCSSISFYWPLNRKVEALKAHNIFLADAYRESFDSIFKRHQIPDEPSFYVNVPSRIDPTAAPTGTESIVVLVPVGHLVPAAPSSQRRNGASLERQAGATQDWDAMVNLARRTALVTSEWTSTALNHSSNGSILTGAPSWA
jgi:phytoene desaturase (3,4-didehydrolycopene-forming)